MNNPNSLVKLVFSLALASAAPMARAQDVFSAVGRNAEDVQASLDAFRVDLGPAIAPGTISLLAIGGVLLAIGRKVR